MERTAAELAELLRVQLPLHGLDSFPIRLEARLKSITVEANAWRRGKDKSHEVKLIFAVAEPEVAGAFEDPDMHLRCEIWISPKMVEAHTEAVVVHRVVGIVQEACSSDVIQLALEAARIERVAENQARN